MSKKIFQQKFQQLLDEELNASSSDSFLNKGKTPFSTNSKKDQLFSKYDPKSEYENLKEKIKRKDSETLAKIKFRKAQARKNEAINADSSSDRFKNSNIIIDDASQDFNQNQELDDFFNNKEPNNEVKNKKNGTFVSIIILLVALLFFAFSFIRLYSSTSDNVNRNYQRCLRDIEKLSQQQAQELGLNCEKPNIFRVMLNSDLASQNYRENAEMIKALGGDLEKTSQELEADILAKIEILKTAGIESYPGMVEVQGLELKEKIEAQENLLSELLEIINNSQDENLQNFKTFEDLLLNIDSIENLTDLENFYQENKELTKSELLVKRIKIQENLENLKNKIKTEKSPEFLAEIESFLALDQKIILTILNQARFLNLESYQTNAFNEEEVNQKILDIAKKQNYPTFGVINSNNLNYNQAYPVSETTSQALKQFFAESQSQNFNPVLLAGYVSPENQNQAFKTTFSELSIAKNQKEFSVLEIQEGMADQVLIEAMAQELPTGLSPFSTGYAVRIQSPSLLFYDWFRQDNFYNLKKFGFIPLKIYEPGPEAGTGEVEMVFIPSLKEIFQINLNTQKEVGEVLNEPNSDQ